MADRRASECYRTGSVTATRYRFSLLQVIYTVRSERQLMERMDYDLLFRWFVGLNIDDAVWDHSTLSFDRERLFDAAIAGKFFE